jgi:predicted RNase H-like nuclease
VSNIKAALETGGASSIIAIDIPIGLADLGPRACDIEARQLLGPRQGSRVFPPPVRAALRGSTYSECCELNRQMCGKAISRQAHAIIPKIRKVDEAITPALQARVREVHPEVSFRLLKGRPLQHSKKTSAGRKERVEILDSEGLGFDPQFERLRLGRSLLAIDDLLDAAACLLTAERIAEGRAQVLGDGAIDSRGLRMEIVA